MSKYFKSVPLWLQRFTNPVDSVYHSCTLIKTLLQLAAIILLAIYIAGFRQNNLFDIVLAAFIIAPLFQTFGFNGLMGFVDHSTTYTFFYALPFVLILLFFLPFFQMYYHGRSILS